MIYTLENDLLKVQINSMGAELWSIYDKRNGTEHIWQGDPAIWNRRAPNLFPFCGRLKNNQYIMGGKVYKATLHGFSRDYEHKPVQRNETSVTFRLEDNAETLEKYPFDFKLDVRYELTWDKLLCGFEVLNTGSCLMPFSIGYHTGYMCPFDKEHPITDYSLVFEKKEVAEEIMCDENGLLSGDKRLYLDGQDTIPLHDGLFPSSFALSGLKSEYVSIVENTTGRGVRVHIKDFPYVVFWSVPDQVRFVCIEPWYGLPDEAHTEGFFDQKPGILKIKPGESFNCAQIIEIMND